MEAVIFIGIQGVGKSTFYQLHFFKTHIRLNLDMLRTKHREEVLLQACIEAKQPFVVDNTNVTIERRARYIEPARAAEFRVSGYYFQSDLRMALDRNSQREGRERVPAAGVVGTYRRLQIPQPNEGFDQLYYVRQSPQNEFIVEAWRDEV